MRTRQDSPTERNGGDGGRVEQRQLLAREKEGKQERPCFVGEETHAEHHALESTQLLLNVWPWASYPAASALSASGAPWTTHGAE